MLQHNCRENRVMLKHNLRDCGTAHCVATRFDLAWHELPGPSCFQAIASMLELRIGFIGAGQMATALGQGFVGAGLLRPQDLAGQRSVGRGPGALRPGDRRPVTADNQEVAAAAGRDLSGRQAAADARR